jgi:hypothetical protein
MKLFFGIIALTLVAASLVADYQWRKWMRDRRRDRE